MKLKILFSIVILLAGCYENSEPILEQEQQTENQINTYFTKKVTIEDVPDISSYLNTSFKNKVLSKNGSNKPLFNFQDILEVVDTLGQATYSINFSMANTPKTVMYNLVIGKDSLGQKTAPIILKYSSKQETYEEWANNDFSFGFFSGNLELFTYSDFFESNTFSKTTKNNDCGIQFDANGDPIPCFRNEITKGAPTNSNSGGGIPTSNNNSSGSGVVFPNSTSRGPGCRISTYWRRCGASNQYKAHSAASCGGDGGGAGWVIRINCTNVGGSLVHSKSSSINDDCDRCKTGISGGVGINTTDDDKIFNELTGKEKCAYEKLNELKLFKFTINKFEKSDNYNLILKSWTSGKCNSSYDEGCADASDLKNGNITIYIQDPQKGTLDVAATILHEGIHAEIYKYVDEYKKGIDPNNRKELLKWYKIYKAKNSTDFATSNAQHQYMSDNFVKPIAKAIRTLDNNKYTLDYYMGFGWDGLRKFGYSGYSDNGKWISLDKGKDTEYYKKQSIVLKNTNFNKNCN